MRYIRKLFSQKVRIIYYEIILRVKIVIMIKKPKILLKFHPLDKYSHLSRLIYKIIYRIYKNLNLSLNHYRKREAIIIYCKMLITIIKLL